MRKLSSTPQGTTPAKAVSGMGPVLIVVLIIIAAILGYYQFVYYPSVATTATSSASVTPVTPHLANITILSGAQSAPRDRTFSPNVATVYIGYNSTVVWTNADAAEHTITANSTDQSTEPAFYSWSVTDVSNGYNNIFHGQTLNFTFTVAGTYGYYCKYHSNMVGTIIVKAASNLSTAATTTQGSNTGSSTTSSMTTAILGGVRLSYFVAEATVFASNLATLTGSGTAP